VRATDRSVWLTDQSAMLKFERRFSTVLYYQNFTEAEKTLRINYRQKSPLDSRDVMGAVASPNQLPILSQNKLIHETR